MNVEMDKNGTGQVRTAPNTDVLQTCSEYDSIVAKIILQAA